MICVSYNGNKRCCFSLTSLYYLHIPWHIKLDWTKLKLFENVHLEVKIPPGVNWLR
jgi:hypothetical protein